ncbi:WXG100 family type VII secretion target [Streptomyces sp. HC307]|uniref:WXG100 family type VII secretion target n=1 Tax=Streptomyces flavusporus TaxID=3385496 RepID=UPI0039176692
MSTPTPAISGSQSENQRAIERLTQAKQGIEMQIDTIDGQVGNLQTQFRGLDGSAYSGLLQEWLSHVMKIVKDLENITTAYGDTARMQSNQTALSVDAVSARQNAQNAMMGN